MIMMGFRKIAFPALLSLLLLSGGIFAPHAAAQMQDQVFAPFVSRLRAVPVDSSIKITWKDSRDISSGEYLVYRHSKQITNKNFEEASLLAVIEPGEELYVDKPLDESSYFYLVLARSASGRLFKLFIPYRNTTVDGVAASLPKSEAELAAKISDISAAKQGEEVQISFTTSADDRQLVLYRSESPITSSRDLLSAVLIRRFSSSRNTITDFPIPGVPYYYAVLDAKLVQRGITEIDSGRNATIRGVRIPLSTDRVGLPEYENMRPIPLPQIQLTRELESGSRLEDGRSILPLNKQELDPETAKAVARVLETISLKKPRAPEPVLLPEDRGESPAGDAYTLQRILKSSFEKRDWESVKDSLYTFLSLNRQTKIEARARFYLGQALFFLGEYRPAAMELLLARKNYYVETEQWLDAVIRALSEEASSRRES
ncbi:MAG: hypothetical protein K9L68_00950 [Spirochaetales bacterium]|nr:hypothetical protein [Spirochaetales bacterium]MCF7937143.1 hypothetical protein [Spirochaetales bacterium]